MNEQEREYFSNTLNYILRSVIAFENEKTGGTVIQI